MKTITQTSAAVFLMAIATASSAQIYKWVDANGQQHYTQRPAPAGSKVESIEDKIRLAAALSKKSKNNKGSSYMPSSTNNENEVDDKEKSLLEEIVTKQKVAEDNYREQLDSYCASQRKNLKQLQSNSPIAWEENGKTELLSGVQKKNKVAEISESVEKNCSVKKAPESD